MIAVFEHRRDVGGHALHAPRADGFHPGLLDGVEYGAGGLALGREPAMERGVVAGEAQRHGVRIAAQDRHVVRGEPPGRLRQARLVAHQGRTVGREGHLQVLLAGNGLHGAGDGALQRLRRRFLLLTRLAVRDGHLIPLPVIPAGA
jgi:hypothetical protein